MIRLEYDLQSSFVALQISVGTLLNTNQMVLDFWNKDGIGYLQ